MQYILKNDNYNICIDTLGAELKSFKFKNEEYLHIGDNKYWHRSSPVLFPIVGRLKNNNYKYKDKNYSLPIHGFSRYHEFELIKANDNILVFEQKQNKITLKHYPFNFALTITYTLMENELDICYQVKSDEDILFQLGAHPAFLLKANINDCFVKFQCKEKQYSYMLDMENGCISEKKGILLDSSILNLNYNIFVNDALIFKNLNSKNVSLCNTMNNKIIKISIDGFENFGIWAPVGAPFVCLEPWCGIADGVNTNYKLEEKISIIKLKKNTPFIKNISISLA